MNIMFVMTNIESGTKSQTINMKGEHEIIIITAI